MSARTSDERPKCSRCQTPMVRYNVPGTGDRQQAWKLACSCVHSAVPELLTSKDGVEPRPSDERNGCFLDRMWCCKVCDGEIPDGHTNECYIWKLEKKHRDFLANEYNAVLTERDQLRATLAAGPAPETCEQPKYTGQRDQWCTLCGGSAWTHACVRAPMNPTPLKAAVLPTEICPTGDDYPHKAHEGKCMYCGAPMNGGGSQP